MSCCNHTWPPPRPPSSPAHPQVTYFAWAMETVPRKIYDACHLYQVRAAAAGVLARLLWLLAGRVPRAAWRCCTP